MGFKNLLKSLIINLPYPPYSKSNANQISEDTLTQLLLKSYESLPIIIVQEGPRYRDCNKLCLSKIHPMRYRKSHLAQIFRSRKFD